MTERVLADHLGANDGAALWTRQALMIVFGVALLWVSAKVKIPLEPVPTTLQVLAIMALSMAYGARMSAATLLAYLALGAAGEPVFASTPEKGIGVPYMLGATGGYLMGFLAGAWVVGALADRGWDRNFLTAFAAMAIGLAVLYVPGVLWLAYGFPITALGSEFAGFGVAKGWEWGAAPFLLIDAIKLAVAAIGFPLIWKLIGR
ncbi:MAG: biotin transporter BioY [Pseudomonadota bacterium]